MDMKSWLAEMTHATSSVIPLIWAEHDAVEAATAKLKALEAETERGYRQSQAFMDDLDDDGLATAIHWDTYFGPDKERHHAAIALTDIQATMDARAFSRSSLASSLLQIAKQGLSAVHGGLARVPSGRDVSGVNLKELIWQGRNQSMHWEDGNPHRAVVACFEVLKAAEAAFGDYALRGLAFEVVALLGWKDQAAFEADMMSLA